MSKETAFYGKLAGMTDQWMDLFGYHAPLVVTDTAEEYRACRETRGADGLLDAAQGLARRSGRARLRQHDRLRDVSTLSPGQIAYGALCDERGKMVDDCTAMMRTPDSVRFCGANDRDYEIFTAKAAETSIDVREVTDATPHLCLQGPRAGRSSGV